MRSGIRAAYIGALVSLGFAACSCDPDETGRADPRPFYSPETFDFGSLCAGESLRQELTIENRSPAGLDARFSFEGEAAQSFRIERDGETIDEIGVTGHGSEVVEVVYEPQGNPGEAEAWLIVDTNSKSSPKEEILLTAFFSSNPTTPRLGAQWALCRDEEMCRDDRDACCVNGPVADHDGSASFGQVGVEQEGQIVVALENRGCSPVTITSAELVLDAGEGACAEGDVRLDLPEGGLELPGATDVASHDLKLIFKPSKACNLNGSLTLQTTDPERSGFHFVFAGEGVAGNLQAISPLSPVNFGSVLKDDYEEIEIEVANLGTDTVNVEEIEIRGRDAEHFEFVRLEQCGAPVSDLPVEVNSMYKVCTDPDPANCGDKPPECTSRLVLVTRYQPKSGGEHGYRSSGGEARYLLLEEGGRTSIVELQGNSLPKLKPYPSGFITFGTPAATGCGTQLDHACEPGCLNRVNPGCTTDNDCPEGNRCIDSMCTGVGAANSEAMCATTCGTAQRSFQICNEEGFNDLVISSLSLFHESSGARVEGSPIDNDPDSETRGEEIFRVDPGNCLDEAIGPEDCCQGTIHLLDNRGGGELRASLEIHSNVGEPRVVEILKRTPVVSGPEWEGWTVTPQNPNTFGPVTVRARFSAEHGEITKYVWTMVRVAGASRLELGEIDPSVPCKNLNGDDCWELLNDQLDPCKSDNSDCSVLRFYPDVNGDYEYEVRAFGSICEAPFSTARGEVTAVGQAGG